MKIAVIGAGAAGLSALRHCVSGTNGDQVVCYEKTDQIGGTWVYREETGSDKYDLPIHTSMYKSLRYGRIFLAGNVSFLDSSCNKKYTLIINLNILIFNFTYVHQFYSYNISYYCKKIEFFHKHFLH